CLQPQHDRRAFFSGYQLKTFSQKVQFVMDMRKKCILRVLLSQIRFELPNQSQLGLTWRPMQKLSLADAFDGCSAAKWAL
ncbi:MAG: hypothetical protein QGG71_20550, partial [Pirellulaceae bacterium]|nr:hypothetical protein [Pirellulaceae bacterium]